jgi:carboxymethylenebutenolidase
MCYDSTAQPPDPPGEPGPASAQDLVLTANDGNRFAVYFAQPAETTRAQVLIFPDVRGLHPFYKDLALRFAGQGIGALAMDYFGRTAGLTGREGAFDYQAHVAQMSFPTLMQDARAALAEMSKQNPSAKTFVLGFCFGGGLVLRVGAEDLPLTGLIPFYSGFGRVMPGTEGTPLQVAHKIHFPVLGLYGGADQGIPVELVQQLDVELDKAGVKHELVIYPGAPHSFFDRKYTEFAGASADAWTRVLGFLRETAA